jgi:hypothetical protein
MLGSQALEAAIGLALLFFVIASGASAVVEVVATLLRKRSGELEKALKMLLTGHSIDAAAVRVSAANEDAAADAETLETAFALFKGTSVYQAAAGAARGGKRVVQVGASKAGPSYLAARSFADAVAELLRTHADDPAVKALENTNLGRRLQAMEQDGVKTLTAQKAGLESWFDESMDRLAGAYKRWANAVLFVIGLVFAAVGNFSALNVADELWRDPVARQVLVNSASTVTSGGSGQQPDYSGIAQKVNDVGSLGLPGGWHGIAGWGFEGWLVHVLGWLITAVLVMLGAPFWFEALSRLVSLRAAGSKPSTAANDDASASSRLVRAESNPDSTA